MSRNETVADDAACCLWLFASRRHRPAQGHPVLQHIHSIHDSDTIRVTCDGRHAQVRFYCIDAPELAQRPWGIEGRDRLRAIAPHTVRVVEHDRDRDGRMVGEVFAGERSLNLELVRDRYTAVYPKYCREGRYYAAERHAKAAGLGIWANPGEQQRPWDWRHRR